MTGPSSHGLGGAVRRAHRRGHAARRSARPRLRVRAASGGTSRTDAGVHAEGQLVAFDTEHDIPARGWTLGLNQHLPEDVAVRSARPVPPGFAPRFAAHRGKRLIVTGCWPTPSAIHGGERARGACPRSTRPRCSAEGEAAVGTHDFAACLLPRGTSATTVRTLTRVDVERGADPRVLSVIARGGRLPLQHGAHPRRHHGRHFQSRPRLAPGAVARAPRDPRASRGRDHRGPRTASLLEQVHLDLAGGDRGRDGRS